MLKVVFVRYERLCSIEGGINIDKLHLADVLFCHFGYSGKSFKDVTGLTEDKQVITLGLKVGPLRVLELLRLRCARAMYIIVENKGMGFAVARI